MALKLGLETVLVWASVVCVGTLLGSAVYRIGYQDILVFSLMWKLVLAYHQPTTCTTAPPPTKLAQQIALPSHACAH